MSTLSEKLQLTLATKQNIKRAIENKGISVGDVPFSEYPSKIESIGITSEEWKKQDWHDIQQIRLLDTENYLYKSIYLLDNTEDVILLQGGDAYKTSDSDELITEDGEYTFTGSGDLECSEGYKTRWIIVYKNSINNTQLDYFQNTLLYTIQDGINTLQNFTNCYKLRYVECQDGVTTIADQAFDDCSSLLWISNIYSVTSIGNYAFRNCVYLKGIELEENYSIGQMSFYGCLNIEKLVLRNVTAQNYASIWGCHIKKLILGTTSISLLIPRVDYLYFDENYTIPNFQYSVGGDTYKDNSLQSIGAISKINTNIKFLDLSNVSVSITNISRFMFEEIIINNITTIYDFPSLKRLTNTYNKNSSLSIYNNKNLEEINIPNAVKIGGMYNCPKLTHLYAPKVTEITTYFYNLKKIEQVDLPNLTTISLYTSSDGNNYKLFCDLPNVTHISIPKASISNSAPYRSFLQNCPKLKTIDFQNINILPEKSIYNCGFEQLIIPKSVTKLYISVVTNMPNLKNVVFEDGYNGKYSDSYLFNNTVASCPVLEYIYLPSSITMADSTLTNATYHIGNNCPNLTTIELGQGYSKTLYLKHITTLTKECVVNMLNALADLTGSDTQTLYIYSETLALLSDEEKAIATNKNWTLAS